MARGPCDEAFNAIFKATARALRPLGFRRRGATLRLTRGDTAGLVNFQRSSFSSRDDIRFTVNVGVVYGELLGERVNLDRALEVDAHVRERLGVLSHRHQDHWWAISPSTEVQTLADEISSEVLKTAIPFIEKYMDPHALIALWEVGVADGSVGGMRVAHLDRLKAKYSDPRQEGPGPSAPSKADVPQ